MRISGPTLFLVGLFCAGLFFRLWFAGLVPQPFVYDQEQYYGYALGILKHGLHADLYRLYGYPVIIAPLIYLFGVKSALPWTVFHALLDTMTALMVYWIAKRLDSRRSLPRTSMRGGNDNNSMAAWLAFILYLFNPFTAGYVGVLLSEVVTAFLVTLISAILIRFSERKTIFSLFILSLLLGFLPQVRPVFIVLSIVVFGAISWMKLSLMKNVKDKIINGVIAFILFSLPFWYTIVGNLVYYRQFSVLGVEHTFVRELYASLFIGRGMPFTDEKWGDWPVEAQNAWGAFTSPKDAAGRAIVADRHMKLAVEIIRRDPAAFVRSRIAKMGYVWEKHFVYPYIMGKPSPLVKALTYWGNMVFLTMAAFGIVLTRKNNKMVGYLALLIFLYISFAHVFSTGEERFSLPAYPWVAVFAGYGIWWVYQRLKGSLLS